MFYRLHSRVSCLLLFVAACLILADHHSLAQSNTQNAQGATASGPAYAHRSSEDRHCNPKQKQPSR